MDCNHNCKQELVVTSAIGSVTICGGGTVTINCGNAALRVPQKFLHSFSIMMLDAIKKIETLNKEKQISKSQSREILHNN